jgi:hypothetical protein
MHEFELTIGGTTLRLSNCMIVRYFQLDDKTIQYKFFNWAMAAS